MVKTKAWLMVGLNLILLYCVATGSMYAMWLMALIMLADALSCLYAAYQH